MGDDDPGRLATVAAAVLASDAAPADPSVRASRGAECDAQLARRLAGLFEDVMWVGAAAPARTSARRVEATEGPGELGRLASALSASRAERVLVVDSGLLLPSVDLCLALVAWPEADIVAARPVPGGPPLCLYRCAAALSRARLLLAEGRSDPLELHDGLECAILEAEDLARLEPR